LNPWLGLVADMGFNGKCDFGSDTYNCCDYPFTTLHVGHEGNVIICCTDDVNAECVLGEIKQKGDIKKIWESENFERIRNLFYNGFYNDPAQVIKPCNKCNRLRAIMG
jgi:hypothetical protein